MIIAESTITVINTEEITKGTLIWAKHSSWSEGSTGIVKNVTETSITVLFLPVNQSVQNHFLIPASELRDGEWHVRYSPDGLQTVVSYGGSDGGNGETGEEVEDVNDGE